MKNVIRRLLWLIASGFIATSVHAQDQQIVKSARTEAAPEPGKALVIFVRHSFVVGAYSAPVLDVDVKNADPKPGQLPVDDKVVGILSGYSKIAYQAEPGEHTFMSVPAGGVKGTEFYEPTLLAEGWLNGNRPSIATKKAEALAKWNALPEAEKKKYTLLETDSK